MAAGESGAALPAAVDVAVIGAGIIGASAAYELAKAGQRVALLEKGRVGAEQSGRNWGFVRQQGRDPAELPTIIESLRLWRGLSAEIGEEVGFRQAGTLYLADTPERLAGFEDWTAHARDYQLDTRLIGPAELAAMLPDLQGRWAGAMTTPSDGLAEPSLAAPAIARAAARRGATVAENCAVRGLDLAGGRVAGVITERGRIAADAVLCAGGAWSALLCRRHGVMLPQLKVRGSVLRTGPAPKLVEGAVWGPKAALRRRRDGGYTVAHGGWNEHPLVPDSFRHFFRFLPAWRRERERLHLRLDGRFWSELASPANWAMDRPGPFEQTRVLDPKPNPAITGAALANLRQMLPGLGRIEIVESWAGLIDVTPDALPVIAPVAALPGFYLATGFSGHGFGIGPGAGKLAAEMVRGAPGGLDPAPFALTRFA